MASGLFNAVKAKLLGYLVTQTLDAYLLDGTHAFNQDDDTLATLLANEITDLDYSPVTLAGKAATANDTDNRGEFDCNDIVFSGDMSAAHCLIAATSDSDTLVCSIDFGGTETSTGGGSITVEIGATGLVHLT